MVNIILVLLMIAINCVCLKQAYATELKFIENNHSKFVENTYNDKGEITRTETISINNKHDKYGTSYSFLNSCMNDQYITAINWNGQDGFNYLVSIKNNIKQVIYKTKETLLDHSLNNDCDKIAFFTEVWNINEKKKSLNITNGKGKMIHSWPLDMNSSWFLSKRAWLVTKDSILLTKYTESTDKKAYIVMKNINTGEETTIDKGVDAIVLQKDHGEEIIYCDKMENMRRIIAIDIGTMKKRIIKEYPEEVIIRKLDIMPDNKEIVYLTTEKQKPLITKTVILNLDTMKETKIDFANPDFVPVNP